MVPEAEEVEDGAEKSCEGEKVESCELVVWFLGKAVLNGHCGYDDQKERKGLIIYKRT